MKRTLSLLFSNRAFPTRAQSSFSTRGIEKAVEDIFQLRNFSTSSSSMEKELLIYSNKKQTPVSLRTLMETGRGETLGHFDEFMKSKYAANQAPGASQRILIQVACFLHRELPVRLAHRAIKLEQSPLFLRSGESADYNIPSG